MAWPSTSRPSRPSAGPLCRTVRAPALDHLRRASSGTQLVVHDAAAKADIESPSTCAGQSSVPYRHRPCTVREDASPQARDDGGAGESSRVRQEARSSLGGGGIVSTRYLYVDGHVKEYSGSERCRSTTALSDASRPRCAHVLCRRPSRSPAPLPERAALCQPGHAMPGIVLQSGRSLAKELHVIFDRGGFDHRLFKWLDSERIGFVTYQRDDQIF